MSHTAALPPVSRQAMSLLPSPLKSWELTVVSAQRAIWLVASSTNHSAPSGPIVITVGLLPAVGTWNSAISPVVVMRPMRLLAGSVNHNAPSGPVVMLGGALDGIRNSETEPAGAVPTISLEAGAVDHSAPAAAPGMPTGA